MTMKQSDLKRAVHSVKPEKGMEYRIAEAVAGKKKKGFGARYAAAFGAVGLAAVLCVGALTGGFGAFLGGQGEGITIPQVEISAGGGKAAASMIPLVVYGGRVYLLSPSQMDVQALLALQGDKLGTTTGGLDEWSKPGEYVDFSANIGVVDVFTVKGYDKSFRLLTNVTVDGVDYPQLFECLNGMTIRTGEDVFGLFGIRGNVVSVTYELFDSWNNGKGKIRVLSDLSGIDAFAGALDASKPMAMDDTIWDDQSPDGQKFVTLTLSDGTQVVLRLFKNGTVYYNGLNALFAVDEDAFGTLWAQLK